MALVCVSINKFLLTFPNYKNPINFLLESGALGWLAVSSASDCDMSVTDAHICYVSMQVRGMCSYSAWHNQADHSSGTQFVSSQKDIPVNINVFLWIQTQ